MKQLLLVFLGGGLGSVLRYGLVLFFNTNTGNFPYGTFGANVLGSLLIGIIFGLAIKENFISQNTILFFATGFCGGFTTFSAFALENQMLLKSGDFMTFALYTLGSLMLGIASVFLGIWLTRIF